MALGAELVTNDSEDIFYCSQRVQKKKMESAKAAAQTQKKIDLYHFCHAAVWGENCY